MPQWDDPDARFPMRESERTRIHGKLEPMEETRALSTWAWLLVAVIIAVFTIVVIMVIE